MGCDKALPLGQRTVLAGPGGLHLQEAATICAAIGSVIASFTELTCTAGRQTIVAFFWRRLSGSIHGMLGRGLGKVEGHFHSTGRGVGLIADLVAKAKTFAASQALGIGNDVEIAFRRPALHATMPTMMVLRLGERHAILTGRKISCHGTVLARAMQTSGQS